MGRDFRNRTEEFQAAQLARDIRMKNEISFLLLAVLGIVSILSGCKPAEIRFADPNLEQEARWVTGRLEGPFQATDFKGYDSIFAAEMEIEDLSGLEYWKNLRYLNLRLNLITDITELAYLTNLESLEISFNDFRDISPLSSLRNLTLLDISSNRLSDVSALAGMKNLTVLYIHDNRITDISALASLDKLEKLYARSNMISDLSPLRELPNLTVVWIKFNPLDDASMEIVAELKARGVNIRP